MRIPYGIFKVNINDFILYQGLVTSLLSSRKLMPFFREIEKLDPEVRECLKNVKSSDLNIRADLIW